MWYVSCLYFGVIVIYELGKPCQEAVLSATNSFEGSYSIFVDNSTSDISLFLKNLFPKFTQKQITAGVSEYSDNMGECKSVILLSSCSF
jgi:hypothetical protein